MVVRCLAEGHTYRCPCPATGEGHGVDVDCRLLLRASPRNLVPLSIQLDIPVPRVASTHEAPGFEGESELPPPPSKSAQNQLRIGDPPARQGLLLKAANTTGDIALGLSSSSKGIKDSNGQKAKRMH